MKYINKIAEREIYGDGIGRVELWDLSRCNENEEARVECISQIASICYGKSPKDAKKLVKRLWTESGGLPSSAFEFVRTPTSPGIGSSLRNNSKLPTWESSLYGTDFYASWHKEVVATFKLKVPIFVRSQVVRHRTFSFQELCVSGGTKISTSKGLRTIKALYEQQNKRGTDGRVPALRIYNLQTQRFESEKRYIVVPSGSKKVFKLTAHLTGSRRRHIKATGDHRFLTKEGWKQLRDIKPGDFIATNGEPIWRNREFLAKAKADFLARGIGMKGMAAALCINYNTLKRWMHKFGLQYTPKEVASTYTVWNKGIKGKKSHSYGRHLDDSSRQKIADRLVKDPTTTNRGFRSRVANYWMAEFRRKKILEKYDYKCAMCGATTNLEVDHIKPVSLYPEPAFDENNVQILCHECHAIKTRTDQSLARLTARYVMVESIEEMGTEETFDIQVDNPNHNYVANGFIVHNSRRYVDDKRVPFEFWYPHDTVCPIGYRDVIEGAITTYKEMLDLNMKPEVARAILPQSLYTEFWMQGDDEAWKNYFKLRLDKHTQKEHREVAQAMIELIKKHQPGLYEKIKKESRNDAR